MKKRTQKKLLSAALILAMSAMTFMAGDLYIGDIPGIPTNPEWNETKASDWMKELSDDIKISEINLPGTHDTTTQYVDISFFSKTQMTDVLTQLTNGFRYLDIRLSCDEERMKAVHGFVSCKESGALFAKTLYLEKVLEQCYGFLDEYPTETIVFCVKKDHGDDTDGIFQERLYDYIERNPEYWYLKNENARLGDVRGKLILARRYEDENAYGDERGGLELFWAHQNNTEPVLPQYTESEIKEGLKLYVQDRFCYAIEDKWTAITDSLESPPHASAVQPAQQTGAESTNEKSETELLKEAVFINFLSTKGTLPFGHPRKYANVINPRFLYTPLEYGGSYGWVIVDYGTEQIARHIFETNKKTR